MRGVPLMAGIAVGLATLVGAAALGLGSLTRALPQLDLWLRVVGSALADLFLLRGVPAHIRSDQGPELIAQAVKNWIAEVA